MANIPPDRLLLGLISVVRTLVLDLSRRGVIDAQDFISMLEEIAVTHREAGDPNRLADVIDAISRHLAGSMREGDSDPP